MVDLLYRPDDADDEVRLIFEQLRAEFGREFGFTNHGGTLDTGGMLFVNGVTWAHALDAVARLLAMDRAALLTDAERAALDRRASPQGVLI
jgi:hypothetical protein